jgi:hypothetical protein
LKKSKNKKSKSGEPKVKTTYDKDKIVRKAKLIPMKAIDEAVNEDTDRSGRSEIPVEVKTKIIKIDEEQI